MNPTLKAKLDEMCSKQAAKHSVSEKFINLCISVSILVTKLGVIETFSISKTIDVKESIQSTTQDTSSIVLTGAALAGIDDVNKVKDIYLEVNSLVVPLLQTIYTPPANSAQLAS